MPLDKPELFRKVGIDPPKGILLVGPPGCGKTMLAKAVASHTNASFIRMVGSELAQKYIGEGGRMVRELFSLAKDKSTAIIFLDEIDAIGRSIPGEQYCLSSLPLSSQVYSIKFGQVFNCVYFKICT